MYVRSARLVNVEARPLKRAHNFPRLEIGELGSRALNGHSQFFNDRLLGTKVV